MQTDAVDDGGTGMGHEACVSDAAPLPEWSATVPTPLPRPTLVRHTRMLLNEFKNYVQFDAQDQDALRALWPSVEPMLDDICDDFYARAMAEATTVVVLHDPAQVARLMRTLRVWLKELLNGPWDEAYAARRRRIGEVHVQVGVRHDAMFTAMSTIRDWLFRAAVAADDPGTAVRAVSRVTNMDLALMTSTYHEVRGMQAMRDVQALLVAHMPAMVMLVSDEGRVLASTPSVAFRFGHLSVDGRLLSQVLPDSLVQAMDLNERLARAFSSGLGVTLPRLDIELDGLTSHLAVTIVPIRRDSNVALVHIDDHTIAVRNEALLRRQESLATLGSLSATIAHELRNPLAGISGALQVIASGMEADNRYRPIISKVLDQIRSLNRLVSDLLSFARPREAVLQRDVALHSIAQDVTSLIAVDHPGVTFDVRGEGKAVADPDMLRQILHNLVNNACDAMENQGRVRVLIDGAGLLVEDSGPGIDDATLERLFQPFFTTKLKGTGLGLATSARLADLMNASLRYLPGPSWGGAGFRLDFHPG